MNRADLKHGDVPCFKYLGNHQNLVERCIRLIEGSRFVHVGIVQSVFGATLLLQQDGGWSPDVVFGTPIGAVLKINIKEEALQGHPVSEIIMNGTHFFPVIEQLNMEDLR